jgi:hypothetical protein
MSHGQVESNLSDEDIRQAIGELRFVLRNAADRNHPDLHLILDLTKTLEDLTELRLSKVKATDQLGGAIQKIEEAKTKLGILHRRQRKGEDKLSMNGVGGKLKFLKKD